MKADATSIARQLIETVSLIRSAQSVLARVPGMANIVVEIDDRLLAVEDLLSGMEDQ